MILYGQLVMYHVVLSILFFLNINYILKYRLSTPKPSKIQLAKTPLENDNVISYSLLHKRNVFRQESTATKI